MIFMTSMCFNLMSDGFRGDGCEAEQVKKRSPRSSKHEVSLMRFAERIRIPCVFVSCGDASYG